MLSRRQMIAHMIYDVFKFNGVQVRAWEETLIMERELDRDRLGSLPHRQSRRSVKNALALYQSDQVQRKKIQRVVQTWKTNSRKSPLLKKKKVEVDWTEDSQPLPPRARGSHSVHSSAKIRKEEKAEVNIENKTTFRVHRLVNSLSRVQKSDLAQGRAP